MVDAHRIVRSLQIMLLLAAALTGFSWYEEGKVTQTESLGGETLSVEVQAPAQAPRGPWDENTTFTRENAGIPLDVAPHATIVITHETRHVTARDHEWSATLEQAGLGTGRSPWWASSDPLEIETSGEQARIDIALADTVDDLRRLANESGVPADLSLTVEVEHRAEVTVAGEGQPSSLSSSVDLVPREGFVVVQASEGEASYAQPTERDEIPLLWPSLAIAAVVLEAGAFQLRRGRDPWQQVAGVDAVEVDVLPRPDGAIVADRGALLQAARQRGRCLLVEPKTGRWLVPGEPPLWASPNHPDALDRGDPPGHGEARGRARQGSIPRR